MQCIECDNLNTADDGDGRVDIWCGVMVDGEPFGDGCNMEGYHGECDHFVPLESECCQCRPMQRGKGA